MSLSRSLYQVYVLIIKVPNIQGEPGEMVLVGELMADTERWKTSYSTLGTKPCRLRNPEVNLTN